MTPNPSWTPPHNQSDTLSAALPALGGLLVELVNGKLNSDQLLDKLTHMVRYMFEVESCVIVCTNETASGHPQIITFSGLVLDNADHQGVLTDPALVAELLQICEQRTTRQWQGGKSASRFAASPIHFNESVVGVVLTVGKKELTDSGLQLLNFSAGVAALIHRDRQLSRQKGLAISAASARADNAEYQASRGATMARVASAFARASGRDLLHDALAHVIETELNADGLGLYRLDPEMGQVRLEFQSGLTVSAGTTSGVRHWAHLLEELTRSHEPLFIGDSATHSGTDEAIARRLQEQGIAAAAMLPLVVESRVLGLMSIRFNSRQKFDDHLQVLLGGIADQLALALRNMDTREELEQRTQRLTALARAQHRLTLIAREETLPGGIAEAAHLIVPVSRCDVFVKRMDSLERAACLERGQPASTDFAPLADTSLAEMTARTGVPRMASHLFDDAGITAGWTELCAPVKDGHRVAAVIRLLASPQQTLTSHDFELISILARHAGTAVETTRLFSLQSLQRLRAEGAAELARVALHAKQLKEGASEILQVLDRFVPSIGMAIGIARNRDRVIEYIAARGTLDVLRGQQSTTAQELLNAPAIGEIRECRDLSSVVPDLGAADLADLASECAFILPLVARDRALGTLIVTTPRTSPLQSHHRTTLERVSSSLALALDALLLDEEERLTRDREQLLATAITTVNHPIFILDRSGVRYANPAAAREYGWSQYELMEMQFDQLVVSEGVRLGPTQPAESAGSEKHTPQVNTAVLGNELRQTHDIHRRRNGSEFPAVVAVSPLSGQNGEVIGQVISVRNVTQERQIEEQLRATEKMVAVGELVAGVAHEINNPLTGISAFAQLLLEEDMTEDQHESVTLIKQETDRAKSVIHDLLLFARNSERDTDPVDINDALSQVVRLRAYPLRSGNIEVQLSLAPDLPHVRGDAQKLQQVFLNIITNAEYAMTGRNLRVLMLKTEMKGRQVVISASDTGKGMTPEVERRIFEPFFSTRPSGAGSGLGLSVSYGIIRAHGGTISVDSEPDVGTTVRITLPALHD